MGKNTIEYQKERKRARNSLNKKGRKGKSMGWMFGMRGSLDRKAVVRKLS